MVKVIRSAKSDKSNNVPSMTPIVRAILEAAGLSLCLWEAIETDAPRSPRERDALLTALTTWRDAWRDAFEGDSWQLKALDAAIESGDLCLMRAAAAAYVKDQAKWEAESRRADAA